MAERIKALRPDIRIIFGGISSTYYADELIRYPFIDMVMRGYDTHEPMHELLGDVRAVRAPIAVVEPALEVAHAAMRDNGFSHKPDTFGCGIDWSMQPQEPRPRDPADPRDAVHAERRLRLQLRLVRRLARRLPARLQAQARHGAQAAR